MVTVPGIVRALSQADSFREAVAAGSSGSVDVALADGLDAPLLAALIDRRRAAGQPPVILVIAPTGRRAETISA